MYAGSMIGSGIYIDSVDNTRNIGRVGLLMMVWMIIGFMTIAVALSYRELSTMFHNAGGRNIYLKEAYNSIIAFLFGWIRNSDICFIPKYQRFL